MIVINRSLLFFFLSFSILNSDVKKESTNLDSTKVDYRLDPVVVTATKVAVSQRSLAASISMVYHQDIRMAPTSSVLDIVQSYVPDLYVTEWGVMGFGVAGQSAGKISIRGMGGGANTHVLILRNGRPDFMGLMGCTIADEFSTDGTDHIEIIRGPGSFLYGTNATGGVINIMPRRMEKEGFETRIATGYGSFDIRKFSINHGGRVGRFDYYITASHRQTDGHRENSNYRGRHYTLHTGYKIDRNTHVEINSNLADLYLNDPGPVENPRSDNWYDIIRYGGDVTVTRSSKLGETNLKLHGNFGRHKFFDGWRSRDRMLGFMVYQNIKPWRSNTTTIGFDYKRYGGEAEDSSTNYGDFYITEYAPYIHIRQVLLRRWIATVGLRLEHHQLFGNEMLPMLGIVYRPMKSTYLRLSVAKGFRSPSIRELYFWMPANDKLTPDRVWNYEIGLTQKLFDRMRVEVALFRTDGENLIQFSSPPPKWVNSGSYTHTGYEVVSEYFPSDRVGMGLSWSQIDLSKDVFNIPGKKLTAFMNLSMWRVNLSVNFIMIKDLKGAEFPGPGPVAVLHKMDDYSVLNLSARFRIVGHMEAKVDVKNLFNTEYQSMYGYPMPGRYYTVNLSYIL